MKTVKFVDTGWISQRWHHIETLTGPDGVVTTSFDSGLGSLITYYDTTDTINKDITNRDWRGLIRRGMNATTDLSGTVYQLHVDPGYCYAVSKRIPLVSGKVERYIDMVDGGIFMMAKPSGMSSISLTNADNMAKARFISRCRSEQTSFQGLTFLGEAAETIRMLHGNVQSLSKWTERYLRDVKRLAVGQSKRPRRTRDPSAFVKDMREAYLTQTFGYAPLANDLRSAGETLAKMQTDRPYQPRRMIRATATDSDVSYVANNWGTINPGGSNIYLNADALTRSEAIVIYRGMLRGGLDTLNQVNTFLGLDPSNFLPTIYELIPYSWLVDYVTNVGRIVDAVSFNRSSLAWCSKTTVQQVDKRLLNAKAAIGFKNTTFREENFYFLPPSVRWIARVVTRVPNAGSLVPDFTFSLGNLGWRRRLNLTAVASQSGSIQRFIRNLF